MKACGTHVYRSSVVVATTLIIAGTVLALLSLRMPAQATPSKHDPEGMAEHVTLWARVIKHAELITVKSDVSYSVVVCNDNSRPVLIPTEIDGDCLVFRKRNGDLAEYSQRYAHVHFVRGEKHHSLLRLLRPGESATITLSGRVAIPEKSGSGIVVRTAMSEWMLHPDYYTINAEWSCSGYDLLSNDNGSHRLHEAFPDCIVNVTLTFPPVIVKVEAH